MFKNNNIKSHIGFTLTEIQSGFKIPSIKANKAFTLAEVLITLAVIGIVAAMVIPSLNANITENKYKTAYKKAYSELSNAVRQTSTNQEFEIQPQKYDENSNKANFKAIMKYFSVSKKCLDGDHTECWDPDGEKSDLWSNEESIVCTQALGFIDNAGMAWRQAAYHENIIYVDINGFNKPNKFGKDRFIFYLTTENNARLETGLPVGVISWTDQLGESSICGYPPCYFRKWLYE